MRITRRQLRKLLIEQALLHEGKKYKVKVPAGSEGRVYVYDEISKKWKKHSQQTEITGVLDTDDEGVFIDDEGDLNWTSNDYDYAVGPDYYTEVTPEAEETPETQEEETQSSNKGRAEKFDPPISIGGGRSVTHIFYANNKEYALISDGDVMLASNIAGLMSPAQSGQISAYETAQSGLGGRSIVGASSLVNVKADRIGKVYEDPTEESAEEDGKKATYIPISETQILLTPPSGNQETLDYNTLSDESEARFWMDAIDIVNNRGTDITDEQSEDNQGTENQGTGNQGAGNQNQLDFGGMVKYIQKVVGDKEDAKWNRKKSGNTETDDKWKEWLSSNDGYILKVIGGMGIDQVSKTGGSLDAEKYDKAFVDNNADALATVAGFTGRTSLKKVYGMVKKVNELSEDDQNTFKLLFVSAYPEEAELAAEKAGLNLAQELIEEEDDINAINKLTRKEVLDTYTGPRGQKTKLRMGLYLLDRLELAFKRSNKGKIKYLENAFKNVYDRCDDKSKEILDKRREKDSFRNAKSGYEAGTTITDTDPSEKEQTTGETSTAASKQEGNQFLTDEAAKDSDAVREHIDEMEGEVKEAIRGMARKEKQAEKTRVMKAYGFVEFRGGGTGSNKEYVLQTTSGKKIVYSMRQKKVIQETFSRAELYRRRYYGRY